MHLTIKSRLALLILILVGFMVIVGAVGLNGMQTSNRALEGVYTENLLVTQDLGKIDSLARNVMMQLFLSSQHDPRLPVSVLHDHPTAMHIDTIRSNLAELDRIWADFQTKLTSTEAEALAQKFSSLKSRLVTSGVEPALKPFVEGDFDKANEIVFVDALPTYQEMNTTLNELIDYEEALATTAYETALSATQLRRNLMFASLAVAILLSAVLGWQIILRITRPIRDAQNVFVAMSNGNLNSRIQTNGKDEIGHMLLALSDTQDKLRDLILNIQHSAGSISTAASEISTGNTDLSQRTEQQASSLQETASSMEEVASTVKHNTENTAQANQLAGQANASAGTGGEKAEQAVGKMYELTESSEKISGIISLIDGIAFQTNILALNASVEAARAGEQGRGFAVVAQEVRNLAQRSADAAKQIQDLIALNGEVVEQGRVLVEAVGDSMKEIVDYSGKVSELMDEVNRASNEQTMAIDQVSVAISQMDEVTQQNASLVEETATASSSLEDQARDLADAVSYFDVGEAKLEQANKALPAASRSSTALKRPKLPKKPAALAAPAKSKAPTSRTAPKDIPPPARREPPPPAPSEDDWESF
jgi:methyl-accepting chemotaxis protein-1 (serine sensor receptor)